MSLRVKICCISSTDEAELAVECGATALGFVSAMPSGPGVIDEALIAAIVATVPSGVETFLLTSKTETGAIMAQQERCGTGTLQLVDAVASEVLGELRRELPHVGLVQVIHVRDTNSLREAIDVAPFVDALLLDSGNPELVTKELGGTGRTHDWSLSRQIVIRSPVPVYLAGGLRPTNVAAAVKEVIPFGVDVCSGVREKGHLSAAALSAFFGALRHA